MSVIYSALKKVQQDTNLGNLGRKAPKSNSKWFWLIALLSLSLIVLLFLFVILNFKSYGTAKPLPKQAGVKTSPLLKVNLALNGVIVSKHLKLAMINNRAYQLHDRIGDMIITRIDEDRVLLSSQDNHSVLRLG